MTKRASWHDTWLSVAKTVGARSRCVRAQYGAVIVSRDNRVLAVGYNGPPAGKELVGQCDSWCERAISAAKCESVAVDYTDCPAVHAEMNALLRSPNLWTEDSPVLYVNAVTCMRCALTIANSGVKTVHMLITPYEIKREPARTRKLLESYGIQVIIHLEMVHATTDEDVDGA